MQRPVPKIKNLEGHISNLPVDERRALVRTYVKRDESQPALADAFVTPHGTHVWAIAGHMLASGENVNSTADYYCIAPEAVRAAIVYAMQHAGEIEGRLIANSSYWSSDDLQSSGRHPGA